MSLQIYKDHITQIYNKELRLSPFNFHNLPNLVARTMEIVDKYSKLSGDEKCEIVTELISKTISETKPSLKREIALEEIPELITNYINVSHGAVKPPTIKPNNSTDLENIVNDVYNELMKIINKKNLKVENLVKNLPTIITSTISILNSYNEIKGADKKDIALAVLEKIFKIIPINSTVDGDRVKLYRKMASDLINTSISIANGNININQVVEIAKSGFKLIKLCPCFKK